MKKILLHCAFLGGTAFIPLRQQEIPFTPGRPEFTISHNQFAFHLLNTLLQEDTGRGNKLISPLSLYFTLSMLCNGAGHATRDSIVEVLQASEMDLSNLNGLCKELMQQMPLEDEKVTFSMANAIWYNRKRLSLLPNFESMAENFYYTPIQPVNINGRMAINQINQWVDQNTDHRIPAVISHTRPGDWMYLISSLYFRSEWQYPFETAHTYEDIFYTHPGPSKVVSFMKKSAVVPTFSDTSFTMVELPYGMGKDYSLYVLLPEDGDEPVSTFASNLDPNKLNNAFSRMTDQPVELSLPRWECDYWIADLRPVLSRMGMGVAFAPSVGETDFSNMYNDIARKASLSQAVHRTCFRVTENGTDAVANSLPDSAGTIRPSRHPRVIKFDRPFLYVLMEKRRHLFLMAGVVNDPSQGAAH